MLQQRRKDYFQRIIEEFFKKLHDLVNSVNDEDPETKKKQLDSCFLFFFDNFELNRADSVQSIFTKIDDAELSEQYAKLLLIEHQMTGSNVPDNLHKALDLVELLDKTDSTYSWGRIMLREDILNELGDAEKKTQ